MKLKKYMHWIFAILFAGLNIIYLVDSLLITTDFIKMAINAGNIVLLLIGFMAGFYFGMDIESSREKNIESVVSENKKTS